MWVLQIHDILSKPICLKAINLVTSTYQTPWFQLQKIKYFCQGRENLG